ncbi:MAG: Antidote-toxin recognition MazE, bacterial antitoxin [Pseudomonadota bacterium]
MQISERGQVTIPKEYRARFGLLPYTEIEFIPRNNELPKLNLFPATMN